MRRGNEPELLILDGKFVGFNLSADYCAEHEWGIKKIDAAWKRNAETHRLTAYPDLDNDLKFVVAKGGKVALLYFQAHRYEGNTQFPNNGCKESVLLTHSRELWLSKPEKNPRHPPTEKDILRQKIAAAWDEDEFAILVNDKDFVEKLTQLYEALKIGNAVIWLGGAGVFRNAGFCVAIYSNLPPEIIQNWVDHYEDQRKLELASKATGIEEKLTKAGKRWFCLEPKWIAGFKPQNIEPISKYSVIYWLNPHEQQIHKANWFTVEDLELWAEDKGPVMMSKEELEKRRSR